MVDTTAIIVQLVNFRHECYDRRALLVVHLYLFSLVVHIFFIIATVLVTGARLQVAKARLVTVLNERLYQLLALGV